VERFSDVPVLLAGGLNSENVRAAIELVRPFGVDVNSGTKGVDGFKDASRMRDFIREAKLSSRIQAVRAGAKAYLLKDAPLEELLDAIRKVHAGETFIPPALGTELASRMSGEALTGREIDVLRLLVRGRSNKEIGTDLFISETTVKTHVRNIFSKLNVMSRAEAIAVANQRGGESEA
jgi:ATP/maltotriose-dependent transcriptional regulator MalT